MLFIHRTSDDLLSIWDEMPRGTLVVQSGPLGIRPSVILIIGGVLKWSSRFSSLMNDRYHFGSRLKISTDSCEAIAGPKANIPSLGNQDRFGDEDLDRGL